MSLPWVDYHQFMSGRLIALDKQPCVSLVLVGELWRRLFAMCVLRVMGTEVTSECKDDQLCSILKAGIGCSVHRVLDIYYTN